jgi:hypothetical protein
MAFDFKYIPIIKQKGFCPNPIAIHGIPPHADSRANKKVIGTIPWENFWNEQIHYLINGYETGGQFITPNFYWYLNYCPIATIGRGYHLPDYVDFDKEYFDRYAYAKSINWGTLDLKKRRGGLSEKAAKGILGYGMYMSAEKYQCGLAAGLDDYVVDMRTKFRELNTLLPPELRIRFKLSDTDDLIISGWKENGDPQGSQNTMYCRTMFNNPNVFKGKFMNDVLYEEAGEFKFLLKGFSATNAGLKVGLKREGTPIVYGTSGKSGSKDFRAMIKDAEHYQLLYNFMPGYRLMVSGFVGSKNASGELDEVVPNIDALQKEQGLSREQVLGCEDVETNDTRIAAERLALKKAENPDLYLEHFLDFPRTESEALMSIASNNFDKEAIADQQSFLMRQKYPLYSKVVLEYQKNEDGTIGANPTVIMRNAVDTDRDENIVFVRKGAEISLNSQGYKNAYTSGGDSYDQDSALTSKSLGAYVVLARSGHPYKNLLGHSISHKRIPVLLIRNRPRRKEVFYENCLKASIYFNVNGLTLFDAGKPLVIEHFKTFGGRKYLAPRPLSFESEDSNQRHDYGMLMTGGRRSKPQMISLLQTYVLDELDECVFPQIVDGFANYNEVEDDSDWDEIDAMGLGVACDIDRKILKSKKEEKTDTGEQEYVYNPTSQTFDLRLSHELKKDRTENSGQKREVTPNDIFLNLLNSGQV